MLTIAISSFFAVAALAAIAIIIMMFHGYADRIKSVILTEIQSKTDGSAPQERLYRHRIVKSGQTLRGHRVVESPVRMKSLLAAA